tara:strand:- start:354 stop:797 length:444 start_codon:yes stop_codon:yes gene_type:complete
MSNHNKIRPVDKKDLKGKYKILFSTPQSKNSKIPLKFRGLQIFKNKKDAELALKKRIDLTELLREKNRKLMEGNQRAIGNSGGNKLNLIQFSSEIQNLKKLKIKRAIELIKLGNTKTRTMELLIKEFKLKRDSNNGWPNWLRDIKIN